MGEQRAHVRALVLDEHIELTVEVGLDVRDRAVDREGVGEVEAGH